MKTVRIQVYEIIHDIDGDGSTCDGTAIRRFGPKDRVAAEAFAATHTAYGRPCKKPEPSEIPRRLAARWGCL